MEYCFCLTQLGALRERLVGRVKPSGLPRKIEANPFCPFVSLRILANLEICAQFIANYCKGRTNRHGENRCDILHDLSML